MGIERLEARFLHQAYAPHRHDTYAIGITLSGVQVFQYRGERRACLPGQCHVLHPDELHDGGPGTEAGFSYRILYLDPSLIQQALDGRPLPFVADPIVTTPDMVRGILTGLQDLSAPMDDIQRTDIAVSIGDMLVQASTTGNKKNQSLRLDALARIRQLIATDPAGRHEAATLERIADLDRWSLARQFRAAYGTSPSRFRTMRQLDLARREMVAGTPLAEAAITAGFADQSHLSRMFKSAYGLTPATWLSARR